MILAKLQKYLWHRNFFINPLSKSGEIMPMEDLYYETPFKPYDHKFIIVGIYRNVTDEILEYMLNHDWEFIDFSIHENTKCLCLIVKKKKKVRQPWP